MMYTSYLRKQNDIKLTHQMWRDKRNDVHFLRKQNDIKQTHFLRKQNDIKLTFKCEEINEMMYTS